MSTPTLTVVEHVQIPSGYRLVVRVPDTPAAVFAAIVGDQVDENEIQLVDVDDGEGGITQVEQSVPTGDALVTVEWAAEQPVDAQLAETRALIEHALAAAAAPDPEPEPITPPGTEL